MQLILNSVQNNRRRLCYALITALSLLTLWRLIQADIDSEKIIRMALIIAATFVSEDLTTINVGVLIAQGKINFVFGLIACFLGIFIGDLLLYLAGRFLGRAALSRAPLKWVLGREAVDKSSEWFRRRGKFVIFASRFIPGLRLPTYFAAGLLNTGFSQFAFYFFLACALWTPLLIGLSAFLGGEILRIFFQAQQKYFFSAIFAALILYPLAKLVQRLLTHRGRRILWGKWRKWTKWEFWPMYVFYPPVVFYIIFLALKHRSLTAFTFCNPAIPQGGFVGESKTQILAGLHKTPEFIARYELLPASSSSAEKILQAKKFMQSQNLNYPIVLKPDVGQRGSGVKVICTEEDLSQYLQASEQSVIIQEYIAGAEFGVFYYRFPSEKKGRIFSITEKKFPMVTGDGAHSLEQLILNDERAVCLAELYLNKQREPLWAVPESGERVQLVEIGSHCRGAIFLDGMKFKTAALEAAIDRISQCYQGFYFGRYDIRVPDIEAFQNGEGFKIIELNGVTSEATHIYDPKNSLFDAYRVLFAQWRIAFEIGVEVKKIGRGKTRI